MPPSDATSLRGTLDGHLDISGRWFWAADRAVCLGDLANGTSLGGHLPDLAGKSVLLATTEQITAALALIELDGVARRIVICPPDLPREHLSEIAATAEIDAIVLDPDAPDAPSNVPLRIPCTTALAPTDHVVRGNLGTEWVLLTSGTTGVPKMVAHTLAGLTGAIKTGRNPQAPIVWGTFYDIRRFGGLQIFLRAMLCGGSLILSSPHEAVADHLQRLGARGVTHLSGTPSHWRRALMSPAISAISPRYVRLSGEIADQAILDQLRAVFPQAGVAHAYASTEAGVGFDVDDGREGFPAGMVGAGGEVEMKVVDGSLRIRSSRVASRYVGQERPALVDADGFVDTRDMVELRGDRYHFVGRRDGIINVGGLKVHPEEVEAVINRHPDVRMSLVRSRRNPITGEIVVADVLLRAEGAAAGDRAAALKREIMQSCRDGLAEHKVPAMIRFVSALDVTKSGKLARHHA
jgi:acyl-coenzyme A synthetase/AMP-(fatty) acid ligase